MRDHSGSMRRARCVFCFVLLIASAHFLLRSGPPRKQQDFAEPRHSHSGGANQAAFLRRIPENEAMGPFFFFEQRNDFGNVVLRKREIGLIGSLVFRPLDFQTFRPDAFRRPHASAGAQAFLLAPCFGPGWILAWLGSVSSSSLAASSCGCFPVVAGR